MTWWRSTILVIVINSILLLILVTGYRGVHVYRVDANGNYVFPGRYLRTDEVLPLK